MKSATSFFSISPALVKEYIRRYWLVPILGFFFYFLEVLFPLYSNFRKFDSIYSLAETTVKYGGFALPIHFFLAIGMSFAVFSYLHNKTSVTLLQSMPMTRFTLFNSASLAGFIMILVPMVATGVLMLPMAGAVVADVSSITNISRPDDIFNIVNILKWIAEGCIIMVFTYAIANFAAIIAGNGGIHLLLAGFLSGIAPLALFLLDLYRMTFLLGYPFGARMASYLHLSPITYFAGTESYLSTAHIGHIIVYLVVACVLGILARLLYQEVKIERTGDASFFPIAADILSMILTFMAMSMFAYILSTPTPGRGNTLFIFTALIASVIFFVIFRMIAETRLAVFSVRNFKKFAIYLVIVCVLFAFTIFDITGYSKNLPAANEVKSVEIDDSMANLTDMPVTLTSESGIEKVIALQKSIIDSQGRYTSHEEEYVTPDYDITYHMKDGSVIRRMYESDFVGMQSEVNESRKKLYQDEEYLSQIGFSRAVVEKEFTEVSILTALWDDEYEVDEDYIDERPRTIIAREDWQSLMDEYNKDLRSRKFLSTLEYDPDPAFTLRISRKVKTDIGTSTTVDFDIDKSYTNTISFLLKKGYINASDVKGINIGKQS